MPRLPENNQNDIINVLREKYDENLPNNPDTTNFHLVLKIFLQNRGALSQNPQKNEYYLILKK